MEFSFYLYFQCYNVDETIAYPGQIFILLSLGDLTRYMTSWSKGASMTSILFRPNFSSALCLLFFNMADFPWVTFWKMTEQRGRSLSERDTRWVAVWWWLLQPRAQGLSGQLAVSWPPIGMAPAQVSSASPLQPKHPTIKNCKFSGARACCQQNAAIKKSRKKKRKNIWDIILRYYDQSTSSATSIRST